MGLADYRRVTKNGIDSHLINYALNIKTGPLALKFGTTVISLIVY